MIQITPQHFSIWSDDERRILRETYDPGKDGAIRTQRALADAGYERSLHAIYNRIRRERRVQADELSCRVDRPLTATSVDLIRDYTDRGYTIDEIAEELNRLPSVIATVLRNDCDGLLL